MLTVALVVTIIAAIGFAWWSARRTVERQQAFLASSACPTCRTVFGEETAKRAHQQQVTACDDTRKTNPGLKINFVREWAVVRPRCGSKAKFRYETATLVRDAA